MKLVNLGIFMLLAAGIIFVVMSLTSPSAVYKAQKPVDTFPKIEQEQPLEELILPKTHETETGHKEIINADITAYSEIDSCHYPNCAMKSGKRAYIGACACPREIELGTKVKIESVGVFTCEDRTAEYLDGRFDVFIGYGVNAYHTALNFGVQNLKVEIIK